MKEIGRPNRLIAYDTDINMMRRKEGKPPIYRPIRPRTILYAAVLAVVASVMLYALLNRSTALIAAQHNRNPLYVALSDGSVRNDLTVHISNKGAEVRTFALTVEGLPPAKLAAAGVDQAPDGRLLIPVQPDEVRELRLSVTTAGGVATGDNTPFTIVATDVASGDRLTVGDHFFSTK